MRTLLMLVGLSLAGCPATQSQSLDGEPDLDAQPFDGGPTDASPLDDATPDSATPDARLDAGIDLGLDAAVDPDATVQIDADVADMAVPPGCLGYTGAMEVGRIDGPILAEASGIAASRQTPGVLWIHNDSGNASAVYAVSTEGLVLGWVPLPPTIDLEDIAIARCPAAERWCLWLADIGDNGESRDDVRILVVPEPPISEGEIIVDGITTLTRTYADSPHDAEALVVAEDGQRFWIITKVDESQTQVFTSTAGAGPRGGLTEVARFDAPGIAVPLGRAVTGADLHPSGERLALRVYTGSYEYWLGDGGVEALATATARQITLGPFAELQGEAIGYAADGEGLWTVSEQVNGDQPLHRYDCTP